MKETTKYTRTIEVAQIAVIMADEGRVDKLYDLLHSKGYIEITEMMAYWAQEFYRKYKGFDWEALIEDDPKCMKEFPGCICWDDAVMYYANKKIEECQK